MSNRHEFDETCAGDLRLWRATFETLLTAYRGFRPDPEDWNRRAPGRGALARPFGREVEDPDRMIGWGEEQLANPLASEIVVRSISVGNMRDARAATFA